MDDIVEKLREYYENWSLGNKGPAILAQAADLIESLRSDSARLAKELEEARKAAKDIEKKAMWLRGDSAYREFPTFVTNRLRAAIRHKATVTTDDLPEGGSET